MGNEPNGIPAREHPELRGLQRGGKRSGMEKLILMVAAFAFASCGGKQLGGGGGADGSAGSSGNGGSSGAGGSAGAGGSLGSGGSLGASGGSGAGGSTGSPIDGGMSDAESHECRPDGSTCVFCQKKWHCDGFAWPACPPGLDASMSCTGVVKGGLCLDCSGGSGTEWRCAGGNWLVSPGFATCSP
jgi:hypothetical protein